MGFAVFVGVTLFVTTTGGFEAGLVGTFATGKEVLMGGGG